MPNSPPPRTLHNVTVFFTKRLLPTSSGHGMVQKLCECLCLPVQYMRCAVQTSIRVQPGGPPQSAPCIQHCLARAQQVPDGVMAHVCKLLDVQLILCGLEYADWIGWLAPSAVNYSELLPFGWRVLCLVEMPREILRAARAC